MVGKDRKKKDPQTSISNIPTVAAMLSNAIRVHQSRQITQTDQTAAQGQTQDNQIVAGPSTSTLVDQAADHLSVLAVDQAADHLSALAGPSTSTLVDQASSDHLAASTSTADGQLQVISGLQALRRKGGGNWISSSVSIGQDQAFNEVCKFLAENDVGMLGIYGMGGVGKTTLMNKIWNEFLVPSNYRVVYVVVSRPLNVDRIQEEIMKGLHLSFQKDACSHKRAMDISVAIGQFSGKLALLFDDLWEYLDLRMIGVLGEISLDVSVFKIIFTTRLEDVSSHMHPDKEIKIQPLGWDDSWELFEKNVGRKTLDSHNEIPELAKNVARECGGLPLALIVIGRAMTCNYSPEAWVDALYTLQNSPSKVPGSEKKLFSILKFSFDNIQNDVEKECFLFCCLYPEDWQIDRGELVELWIGDGILDLVGTYCDMRNRGHAIVHRLLAACLLELKYGHLIMHDIIRDMGLWIASESRFFVHGGQLKLTKDQSMNRWREACGIYALDGNDLPEQPLCQNLSTLILNNRGRQEDFRVENSLFQFMGKLRILKASRIEFSDTSLDIVGQLVELRFLELVGTNITKFPSELGNLRKLNVLKIEFERKQAVSLPPDIGQLRQLSELWINGGASIKALPVELGKLSKLEELVFGDRSFHVYRRGNFAGKDVLYKDDFINQIPQGIFEGLAELRRLELSVTSVSILPADLWNLTKLKHLSIDSLELPVERDGEGMGDQGDEFIYEIAECPPWLNADNVGFSAIESLKRLSKSLGSLVMTRWPIFKWEDIRSTLEAMSEMYALEIGDFPIDEIVISKSNCFSKLNALDIGRCPKLEKLQLVGGDALNGLSFLTITDCASLKHINIGLEHLQHLIHLSIEYCPELEGELIKPNEGIGSSPILSFNRLETIILRRLPEVTIICSDNVSFPCLSILNVFECDKLEKFPRGLMNEERPLQGVIKGKKEWWEGVQWQDEDFKSYLHPLFGPA